MTSADFLQFSRMSPYGFDGCHYFVLRPIARPPQLRTVTFLSYICCIYTIGFGQYWTSLCLASSSSLYMPSMQFLFVRPRVCYGLTSYSTSRWTHLPSANSSYCQACSGLPPPSYCPFWANQKIRSVHVAERIFSDIGLNCQIYCSVRRKKSQNVKVNALHNVVNMTLQAVMVP